MITAEKKSIAKLRQEVKVLRDLVMSMVVHDEEGEYNPKFVRKVLKLAKSSRPTYTFTNKEALLKLLSS